MRQQALRVVACDLAGRLDVLMCRRQCVLAQQGLHLATEQPAWPERLLRRARPL